MKLQITGSLRSIAESAWISTLDEIKAKARSDEDVEKVCRYLIENSHTSPFECVTLTFSEEEGDIQNWWGYEDYSYEFRYGIMHAYIDNKYTRSGFNSNLKSHVTIDLLNFVKMTFQEFENIDDSPAWKLFAEQEPDIAKIVSLYDLNKSKILPSEDVSERLGQHNMKVELINFHDTGDVHSSRATWRVKCPLSIAVQKIRHRTGSFNMTSGRYRMINQEMTVMFDDCKNILNKMNINGDEYFDFVDHTIIEYKNLMRNLKQAKDNEQISNDEYKRMREVARYVLPEGRLTELYVTFYLDDFQDYLKLRDSAHAQVEHIWIAQQMKKTLEDYNVPSEA